MFTNVADEGWAIVGDVLSGHLNKEEQKCFKYTLVRIYQNCSRSQCFTFYTIN